jgi:hypothetical protein
MIFGSTRVLRIQPRLGPGSTEEMCYVYSIRSIVRSSGSWYGVRYERVGEPLMRELLGFLMLVALLVVVAFTL